MVPADTGRAAVLAPGGGYSTDGPLLMHAGLAVERRGGYARRIVWALPEPEGLADSRARVAARSSTPHVIEVAGADHGMFVPGELSASAAVLGQVMSAVEQFLDHAVWP
jgi:hypothetical protein